MSEIRIYVACLSSYNSGTLHGRWIDATQGVEHIREEVATMLAESKHEPHEEWAIHDFEGFGNIKLSEYESFDRVADLADAIEEHGEPFIAFHSNQGMDDDVDVEKFQESYRGEYASLTDYAEEFIDGCYSLKEIPDIIRNHIDYEGLGRDMELGGDIFTVDGGRGCYVFDNN